MGVEMRRMSEELALLSDVARIANDPTACHLVPEDQQTALA